MGNNSTRGTCVVTIKKSASARVSHGKYTRTLTAWRARVIGVHVYAHVSRVSTTYTSYYGVVVLPIPPTNPRTFSTPLYVFPGGGHLTFGWINSPPNPFPSKIFIYLTFFRMFHYIRSYSIDSHHR